MTAISTYTHPSGAVYATPGGLSQAQTLTAMGHHAHSAHVNGLVATVSNMGLSPTIATMAIPHHSSSMQKLLSLPPPKVRETVYANWIQYILLLLHLHF